MGSTKAWHRGVGTSFSCGLHLAIAPGCRLAEHSAAAPNTYWDSRGHDPEGVVAAGSGGSSRAGPDALAFPPTRPFWSAGSSPKGCPVCGGSAGWGRRRGLVPGGAGWAGEVVSVAGDCHSSFEWPTLSCSLLGPVARPRARFPSPVLPRRRVFIHAITSVLLLKGSSVFVGAGSAAHPSDWLPAFQPPTHDSD